MTALARKRRFLWQSILGAIADLFFVQPPRDLTPAEWMGLEESTVALTNWTRAGLSLEDVNAYIQAAPEGKTVRGLRMLEGVAKLDAPSSYIGEVLAFVPMRDLMACAVKNGLDFCPGAISMLRLMDRDRVDDFLNEAVGFQVKEAREMAERNAVVMERLGIGLSREVAEVILPCDQFDWP